MSRKAILLVLVTALTLASPLGGYAKGKGFKDVVKHFEKQYGAKKTKIPMLGLANFAIKLVRPAGVKGFKLAVFEDQDFLARAGTEPFGTVMRSAYNKDWQPLIQINSKRSGGSRTFIYARNAGKDVQFAMVAFEDREAVVLEVKFNPDAAAKFLENPKIMGISLGNSIRGGGNNNGNNSVAANRPQRDSAATGDSAPPVGPPQVNRSANDVYINPVPEQPKARSPLSVQANDENNPPLPALPAAPAPSGESAKETVKPVEVKPDKDAIRIETRLVNLNVKAMDQTGQPLTNLKPEDFAIYEDGVKQEVSHFKPVAAPVNVILLLDLSGSTKQKRNSMKAAAAKFIDVLPAQDQIAIVAFTRRYRALTKFTSDKMKLKSVLDEINGIAGGTAFYSSMWKALDELDQLKDVRKAIVVLTDGEDDRLMNNRDNSEDPNADRITFDHLLERTSEDDVTIYPIYFKASVQVDRIGVLFGNGNLMGNDRAKIARRQLDQVAEQTGGEVFSAQREEDLESAYQRVAGELHTLYSLAYSPDQLKHNGEFRKVSVKLKREGAIARTRRGYYDK